MMSMPLQDMSEIIRLGIEITKQFLHIHDEGDEMSNIRPPAKAPEWPPTKCESYYTDEFTFQRYSRYHGCYRTESFVLYGIQAVLTWITAPLWYPIVLIKRLGELPHTYFKSKLAALGRSYCVRHGIVTIPSPDSPKLSAYRD